MTKRKITESLLLSQQQQQHVMNNTCHEQHVMDVNINSFRLRVFLQKLTTLLGTLKIFSWHFYSFECHS